MSLTVDCASCGPVLASTSPRGAAIARTRHENSHDPEQLPEGLRVIARAASLRLGVEASKARLRMWQACPAMDRARNAGQVLDEVLELLERAEPDR